MSVMHSLIPGLEEFATHGDARRRADAILKISDLFLHGAARFSADQVKLFDGVLSRLVPQTDIEARGKLAERLCNLENAPPQLIELLVRDDDIMIAGPLLRRSPQVSDPTLVDIAQEKAQTHLLAMSERPTLLPVVTDVIVRRGDGDVVRKVAANAGAAFSLTGYSGLIRRAGDDGALAVTVGQRDDLSSGQLKELLSRSADLVRQQLFEAAKPSHKALIGRAIADISGAKKSGSTARDFASAQRAILALQRGDGLTEDVLMRFARAHHYEETVAALAAMSGVRMSIIDHLMKGDRDDPILILGKSIGVSWATVRALMALRLGPGRAASAPDVEDARQNFERLVPATAQRVLTFWQTREPTTAVVN